MVIDQNDYLRIAYRGIDSSSAVIYHAWKGPNSPWQAEVVGNEPGSSPDITVDSSGVVHIVYLLGGDIRYAVAPSTSWSIDTLTHSSFSQATEVAIEVSDQGRVHIAYSHGNSVSQLYGMGHAYKTATGSWSYEVVDNGDFSGVDIGVNPLCATPFSGDDCPVVSYVDSVDGHIKFGERSQNGQWTVENVFGASALGKTRLSIDVNELQKGYLNSVHIAAYNELPSGVPAIMRHSRPLTSGEWSVPQIVEVDTGGDVYLATSGTGLHMVYSRSGREWPGGINLATYQAPSGEDLHLSYAFVAPDVEFNVYRQLGTGARSIIDTVEDNSYDNTDVIQEVVYSYSLEATQNSIIGDLTYFDEGHAAAWVVETIDDSGNDVGESVSIAYAEGDSLHIAYLDTTEDDLLYVPYSSSSLVAGTPEIVDGARVQNATDIIVDYGGNKHISYFVGHPDNDLAYAWSGSDSSWQLSRPDEPGTIGQHSSITFADSFIDSATSRNGVAVGSMTSVAIGSDGLGLISYKVPGGGLAVVHCSNVACTSSTTTTLDTVDSVGWYSSLAIGSDGLGLISYHDLTNDHLKVAHCSNVACTSATITTLAPGDMDRYSSLAIGSDGLGLISFQAPSQNVPNRKLLKVAHCLDVACTSATITTLDNNAGQSDLQPSLAIGSDGLGLISYHFTSYSGSRLRVAHCSDVACTSATFTQLDTAESGGLSPSLAIGSDGLGLISYGTLAPNFDFRIAHCSDVACTSATVVTFDTGDSPTERSPVTIGPHGRGMVIYIDGSNNELKIANCLDVACTSATIATLDLPYYELGGPPSVTIGSDGLVLISYRDSVYGIGVARFDTMVPVIAFYDSTNNSLKFANASSTSGVNSSDWSAQTVYQDSSSNNGQYTGVVYDASVLTVHISYFSPTGLGTLNHITGTWDNISQEYQWSSPVEIAGGSSTLRYSALTLDPDGRPHVVFRQGGAIKHAWGLWSAATNSWSWTPMTVEEIQSGVGSAGGVELVTGAANSLHISFYDDNLGTLNYASASYNSVNDSWAWQVESIDGSSSLDVGEYSAITIDESGMVFIAYYDATNGNLKIAHN